MGKNNNIILQVNEEYLYLKSYDIIEFICSLVLKKYNSGLAIPLNSIVGISGNVSKMCKDVRIAWSKSLLFDQSEALSLGRDNITGVKVYILSDLLKSRGYI